MPTCVQLACLANYPPNQNLLIKAARTNWMAKPLRHFGNETDTRLFMPHGNVSAAERLR